MPWTVVGEARHRSLLFWMDDPVANSHVQNICFPDPDAHLTIEEYERRQEQNDALGISFMRTEDTEPDPGSPSSHDASSAQQPPKEKGAGHEAHVNG
jgi:hypothetical protein